MREVRITTADGLRLLAWYRAPAEGRPVLAYLHGNGGSLADRIPRICRFAQTGWAYCSWSIAAMAATGRPSEAALDADARGAMAFLRQQGPAPIVLYGESLGTGVAVRIATSEWPVAALLLESPYTSIVAIARQRYWFMPVGLLMRDPFKLLPLLADIHAPVLVMQGSRDDVVPQTMGRAVFAAAHEPKQLWTAPEGGHADLMAFGAAEAAIKFVRTYVPAAR